MSTLSPMMRHYVSIKEKYPDCLIFYRLGDFYELFFDDAVEASSILELTLTSRDCGLDERAPMCGVPFHAVDGYLNKLVNAGKKVAICEQLTEPDPNNKKELVQRDVVRVVTAGTIIENSLIDEKSNNFISCIYYDGNEFSASWADITTGEFFTQAFTGEKCLSALIDVLVKISPAEIICNVLAYDKLKYLPVFEHNVLPRLDVYLDSEFNLDLAKECLKKQFKLHNLSAYQLDGDTLCIPSAGALISYLLNTQKHSLSNIDAIKVSNQSDYMALDANAIKNLELVKTLRENKRFGSLLWVLDKTKTSMGARTLQSWLLSPLQSINEINDRLNGVKELYSNTLIRQGITEIFKSVKDIGRLSGKISNGNISPKDCYALGESLSVLPSLKFTLSGMTSNAINRINSKINGFSELSKLLLSAINPDATVTLKDGDYIKTGYNEELDELRKMSRDSKSVIIDIEKRERESTGIKTLKIGYNRVFGYYIEVTNSFKDLVPYYYVRKQTLSNCERYVTQELSDLEVKVLSSQELALKLEKKLFNDIKELLLSNIEGLKNTSFAIGELDVLCSLALVAKQNNYVMPTMVDSSKELKIIDGRHPVVESISKEQFVSNDTLLDNNENNMMIITGPNMAGKSTYMRQVALITIMAHVGSFVPAKLAQIPIIDKVYTRIGASDNLALDQSTFMVEMTEVADILLNATKNSLLILDEIGRGTSTFDGLSIAWSVVEHISQKTKAKTLFATHYHELTELEGVMQGIKNYKITVKELNGSIVFMRKIMRGGANKSFGVEVASLAGVPSSVTTRAKQILKELEKKGIKTTNVIENNDAQIVSEVERILLDLDVNRLTPIDAFNILSDLKKKAED